MRKLKNEKSVKKIYKKSISKNDIMLYKTRDYIILRYKNCF